MREGQSADTVSSGLRLLDGLLDGGYPVGDLTILAGASGSGKSLLGLQACRAAGAAGHYALALKGPAESFARRHQPLGSCRELCADSTWHLALVPGALLVVDDLAGYGLLVGHERQAADQLARLAAATPAAIVVLATDSRWAAPVATVVLDLLPQPLPGELRLQVRKREGGVPGSLALRRTGSGLGPLSEAPALAALTATGTRVLAVFRTARRATVRDLSELLLLDEQALRDVCDGLTATGHLVAETDDEGQPCFALPLG
ncbi:MAG: hypothetical protein IT204_13350 [Fimbriimonadaceae bacterium]|nr:hypothetical protein [Fimbriimonadaceae bacterium]